MALHQYDPTFYEQRGYNKDIMPKGPEQRDTSAFNFFTLWMGAVHNIPNYTAVGGFLILGLSPLQVMFALVISSLLIGILLAVNGYAGSKYGIPFAIHLRLTYGDIGAKLPGILRGVIAGIAWFGLQTFAGSVALIIVLNKIFPGFSDIGGGHKFLGITVSGFIAFMLFWLINFCDWIWWRKNSQQIHSSVKSTHLYHFWWNDDLGNQSRWRIFQHFKL